MIIKPCYMDYEDTYFSGDGSPMIDFWGIFLEEEGHACEWMAAFTIKEDAEAFLKMKETL